MASHRALLPVSRPRLLASAQRLQARHPTLRTQQSYATYRDAPRKSVTLVNDDGHVKWTELSAGEKVVRTTKQSVNLLVVLAGFTALVRVDLVCSAPTDDC
jgi:mitochondrial import inner membrane translocase subunit TIM21